MSRYLNQYQPTPAVMSAPDLVGFGQFITQNSLDDAYTRCVISMLPSATKPWLEVTHVIMETIGSLAANWDGYGARPISSTVCTNAKRFLAVNPSTMSSPDITPTSNGTLNLEWASGDAEAYLEIGRTRYTGHIQPRYGDTVYLNGTLTEPVTHDSGVEQALALISGLLHGTSGAPSLAQGIQITESVL
jgi:hypothetical protein